MWYLCTVRKYLCMHHTWTKAPSGKLPPKTLSKFVNPLESELQFEASFPCIGGKSIQLKFVLLKSFQYGLQNLKTKIIRNQQIIHNSTTNCSEC